ncbi:MAG: hypothetical protein ABI653_01455 [Bacteroidota bacterium]
MKLIDYSLGSATVANPDNTMPATVTDCTVVTGPGTLPSGTYSNALDFGSSGKIITALTPAAISTSKFSIRVIFKTDSAITSRQNLVESNCLPFAIFLDKADAPNDFKLAVSVAPAANGWGGTTTEFFQNLKLGTWYTADLVYDTDTVAVFIDDVILSVHAFPSGLISKSVGTQLFIGAWTDGNRNHFNGQIAAIQWYDNEIPDGLEAQLDERRSHPEWFISYKQEQIKSVLNLGNMKGKYVYDTFATAYIQWYDAGLIMYNDSVGAAFEMHGMIFQHYQSATNTNKWALGYLVSNEGNTTKAGGRKNIFSKGGIYWSSGTGAFSVTDQLYLEYEQFGESAFIGWPIAEATNINGGKEQIFQGGRMYYKTGTPKAFEVNGAILTKFLSGGGVNTWGYPVCNESDIMNGSSLKGKFSEFEGCTIYWSSSSGAFEVHGDIRTNYRSLNGPIGQMGFPTSDQGDIPGASAPAKYNTFQNGSILWFGSSDNMFVCQAFKIYLGRIDSQESEGFMMGQNDVYMKAIINDNGSQVYTQRIPNSGDSDGHNVYDFNTLIGTTIIPNSVNRNITFTLDIWESDGGAPFGGGDDHLGTYNKTLNMANAWGMKENNGIFNSGRFQMINSITWSVKPQINENNLTQTQKWWGVQNDKTAELSYAQYAAAFRDVDSDPEWWDLTDWLEKAFYELVVKGLAGNGNCFGMSLEAIYAYKHRSLFSLPLDRFKTWSTVVNEFNIKHQYQVGAAGIWWFVGQFLSGNTHDPVDVFNSTRSEFNRGCDPVLCISQNYDFGGSPHCILPVAWNSNKSPWEISILDPNFPNEVRTLYVDSSKNQFTYDGGNKYQGGEWDGGRLHYMPYSVTNERPRTPIWDAILLILSGAIIILGDDTETVSLTDENGNDLDAFGADSINRLKQKKTLENKFVSIKGFNSKVIGAGTIKTAAGISALHTKDMGISYHPKAIFGSELFMRTNIVNQQFTVTPGIRETGVMANLTLSDIVTDRAAASTLSGLTSNAQLFNALKNRNITHIIQDPAVMKKMDPAAAIALGNIATLANITKNFKHTIKGRNDGNFMYAVKNMLNEFSLQSTVKTGEITNVETKDLGTTSSVVKMITNENKTVRLEINNKLGVGKDKMSIVIDKIPAAIGQELSLNIKPGLAGLDILTTAEKVNATISINGTIDGKAFQRSYGVDLEGGTRIRPSMVISNDELKVGKIDQLFAPLQNGRIIKGK